MIKYLNLALRWLYQWIRPRPIFYHKVTSIGVTTQEREVPLVVSLTSFPRRKKMVPYTIETILSQTVKPDRVILWLADEQFPKKERELPKHLLRLREYGLEIMWTKDIRSYKKLIPSLQLCPDAVIVTADDDVYYPPTWLEKLYDGYKEQPRMIYCHKCVKVETDEDGNLRPYNNWATMSSHDKVGSFLNMQIGSNGVLYPPYSLYKDVTREDIFMNNALDADDIWFWAMALLVNTTIKVVNEPLDPLEGVFSIMPVSLWDENRQGNNDRVIQKLIKLYPKLGELIREQFFSQ